MKLLVASNRGELGERAVSALLDAGHRVCGVCETRARVLELVHSEQPQVLLLDVALLGAQPGSFMQEIAGHCPCAVLLLAQGPQEHLSQVYDAMGSGAVDIVIWEGRDGTRGEDVPRLLAKLATIAKLVGDGPQSSPSSRDPALIAIGASTGGPQALVEVLSSLPKPLLAAVVIVQHVDREFTQGLASWLEDETGLPTDLAKPHHAPQAGRIAVAATNDHLVLTAAKTFAYTPNPSDLNYRPSVDVFFRSVAKNWARPGVAALLTGMGRDGAEGLLALKRARWFTIAQNEETCIVFGMPKAAIELGAAQRVLPLSEIGRALTAPRR